MSNQERGHCRIPDSRHGALREELIPQASTSATALRAAAFKSPLSSVSLCVLAAIMNRPGGDATNHQVGDFDWMNEAITGKKSFWQRAKEEPLVPFGCAVTAAVLLGGLVTFQRGHSRLGNLFMQARVVAQGGTVVAIAGGAYLAATEKKEDKKKSYEERQKIELRD